MEIVNVYKQDVPATRFAGKKYGDEDRVNGGFGTQWGQWIQNKWFEPLEPLAADFADADANIGLMRWKEGEPFEYYIGMFLKEGADVPQGYEIVDFGESSYAVAWLKGKEDELYGHESEAARACSQEGYDAAPDENGAYWFFERYSCPRFTTPDENREVILDIGHFM